MNGITAQLISLVSHGNEYLTSRQLPVDYYPANAAFRYCRLVDFWDIKKSFLGNPKEVKIAATPLEWFPFIRKEGCTKLRLYYELLPQSNVGPPHKLAAFVGGGGTWLIEAMYKKDSDFWAPRWQATHPQDPDQLIWSVNYGRTSNHYASSNMRPDVHEKAAELHSNLVQIRDFAIEQNYPEWGSVFQQALDDLEGAAADPAAKFGDFLVAKNHTPEAIHLLQACSSAWVFGGMGSWNDLSFDTDAANARYDALSAALYQAVIQGALAAANSF